MSTSLKIPVTHADHSTGPETAPLTLVQYGDYQCPHCARAFPIVKHLQKTFGADLRFVFRNFPLTEVHPDALNAAKAAEAAGLQKKFWEMHDLLYEEQEHLDPASLLRYAHRLGLDQPDFEAAMAAPEIEARIERDFEGGIRSGVNGTPAFYVNGLRYDGDWSSEPFTRALRHVVSGR